MEKTISKLNHIPITLLFLINAYSQNAEQPIGRLSAGEGWLEAYLRYGGNKKHYLVVTKAQEANWFHQKAITFNPAAEIEGSTIDRWGYAASKTGAILLPGPGLDEWAWKRMPWGDGAFSLIGLVHTLCSRNLQWGLGQFSASPTREWDALICTSNASKSVIEGFLNRQEKWIKHRFQGKKFERPQLPVIPLGVHPEKWNPINMKVDECRKESRLKLGISDEALIVLMAGRMDILTKNHPAQSFRVLAELLKKFPNLQLIIYGESPNTNQQKLWEKGAQSVAPELKIHWIPGRQENLATTVRWASDVFISIVDNPQETFGITPLEAMASGLPCIVSDWDGYRDTVIQPGESNEPTGFRIPTYIVEDLGQEESFYLLQNCMKYEQAVGQVAQGIAINMNNLRENLEKLLSDRNLRIFMGQNGIKRIDQKYSWKTIMNSWKNLTEELQQRRQSAIKSNLISSKSLPHWLPSTYDGFHYFATENISKSSELEWDNELKNLDNVSRKEIIYNRLKEPFEGWSSDGIGSNLQEIINNPNKLPARAKGWLIKQGWLKLKNK